MTEINETPFWEVFRNKYLIRQILNQIEEIEWIEYDDYKQIHVENKMKFKNIISLECMTKNKQFELLKCKLNAGEYIRITKSNLISFLSSFDLVNHDIGYFVELFNKIVKHLAINKQGDDQYIQCVQQLQEIIIQSGNFEIFQLYKQQQADNGPTQHGSAQHLELKEIIKIQSIEFQNKLIQLEYFQTTMKQFNNLCEELVKDYYLEMPTKNEGSLKFTMEKMQVYLRVYYKCYNGGKSRGSGKGNDIPEYIQIEINEIEEITDDQEKHKQLLKLFIDEIDSKHLNKYYESKYGASTSSTKSNYSTESKYDIKELKLLISNNGEAGENDLEIIEFIKLYTGQKLHKPDILTIRDAVFSMGTNENYELAFDSIDQSVRGKYFFENAKPKHHREMSSMVSRNKTWLIKDKDTIDWILQDTTKSNGIIQNVKNEYLSRRKSHPSKQKMAIQFDSYEIARYAESTDPVNSHFPPVRWFQVLDNPLSVILKQFAQTLQLPINTKLGDFPLDTIIEIINQLSVKYGETMYLSDSILVFREDLFLYLFRIALKKGIFNPNYSFSISKLFRLYPQQTYMKLFNSIMEYDLDVTEYILNNFTVFSETEAQTLPYFQIVWQASYNNFFKPLENALYDRNDICTLKGVDVEKVIKYITFWVDYADIHGRTLNEYANTNIELILDHCYKRLIQIKGVKIESLIQVKQIFDESQSSGGNNIDFRFHKTSSLYHSWYYLNIKSPKFIKYFMSKPYLYTILVEYFVHKYSTDTVYQTNDYNIIDYIDPILFSYDNLFIDQDSDCYSFDQVVNQLFLMLDGDRKPIEEDLEYCIDIRRLDLLFSKLDDYIKNQINSYGYLFISSKQLCIKFCQSISNASFNLLDSFIEKVGIITNNSNLHLDILNYSIYDIERIDIIEYILNQYNNTIDLTKLFNQYNISSVVGGKNYQILNYLNNRAVQNK